jgi:hypothetical protein
LTKSFAQENQPVISEILHRLCVAAIENVKLHVIIINVYSFTQILLPLYAFIINTGPPRGNQPGLRRRLAGMP